MCIAEGGSEEIDGNLVALLQKDEVVRKVTQIFCLERLASGDTLTAQTLLANMVAVRTSPTSQPAQPSFYVLGLGTVVFAVAGYRYDPFICLLCLFTNAC